MLNLWNSASANDKKNVDDGAVKREETDATDEKTDVCESATAAASETAEVAKSVEVAEAIEVAELAESGEEPNASAENGGENGELLREIFDVATALRQDFDVKFKFDKKKDEQVDRLYEECKAYRDDVFWALKKDLILEIICEIDEIEKRASAYESRERTPELCEKMLTFIRDTAENLRVALEKHDVFAYSAPDGSQFDPARQRALGTRTTNDETLDKTVETARFGFDYEANGKKRNVRRELVYVYKYEPPTADATESKNDEMESAERPAAEIGVAANESEANETLKSNADVNADK